jgi:hypothetical protein
MAELGRRALRGRAHDAGHDGIGVIRDRHDIVRQVFRVVPRIVGEAAQEDEERFGR